MRTELISIPTDTVPLEGAFYEPEEGPTTGSIIFFHGNTMNFYVGAPRFLPPALVELGFVCLAFNRRGHDILSVRNDKRRLEGAAFQTTAEALADHTYAAEWLTARGLPNPVVVGHSNGAVMAVPHVIERPLTPALVMLSAGAGGPARTQRVGLLAGDRMHSYAARARALVARGRGAELMVVPGWWYLITAESFLDRIETVPDILALAPQVSCPVLYIRGDQESPEAFPAELFRDRSGGPCEAVVVANCDHFYNGREDDIVDLVTDFLTRTLELPPTTPLAVM